MKLLLLPLIFSAVFLFSESSLQDENYNGKITVYSGCQFFQDPLNVIRNNKQFFIDKRILVIRDTAESKCGYLLVNNFKKEMYVDIQSDKEFLSVCEEFFFPRPPKKPVAQYKLLK